MDGVAIRTRRIPLLDAVVRRLQGFSPLSTQALDLLYGLDDLQAFATGAELIGEGRAAPTPRFLVCGWAARVRLLADGRRQILGFILPGDGIGLCLKPQPLALAATVALTSLQTVDAGPVLRALAGPAPPPGLAEALRIAACFGEALLLDQVMRLGRQTAYERICHFLLEFRDRLAEVGLAQDDAFPLPLTQETLADATGLSVVHVNRILQQLRREGLLDLRGGRAGLPDAERLRSLADYRGFEPAAWAAGAPPVGEAAAWPRPA